MRYCKYCMSEMDDDSRFCSYCGRDQNQAEPAHHLKAGTSLVGRYVVGAALGEGGFGITYVGRDKMFDTKVAIKEYYPAGYANRDTLASTVSYGSTAERADFFKTGKARFLREAQTLAMFANEPGIVAVKSFFEANNTAYLVMELLEGYTLKKYLSQKGRLTPDQALQLLLPVMRSLKKVHAAGLVHRDISPDNIMITKKGIKLLDFGAARNMSAIANKSLSIMLKPGYAPEEQYRSRGEQGPWTDVYALCATIYKCITGKRPDDATQRVFSDDLEPPSKLGVDVTPQFEAALMKGLGVFSRNRIQNIDELIEAFTKKPEEPATPEVFLKPAAAAVAAVPEEPYIDYAQGAPEEPSVPEMQGAPEEPSVPEMQEAPEEPPVVGMREVPEEQPEDVYTKAPEDYIGLSSEGDLETEYFTENKPNKPKKSEEDSISAFFASQNKPDAGDPGTVEYSDYASTDRNDTDSLPIYNGQEDTYDPDSEDDSEDDSNDAASLALLIFGIIAAIGAAVILLTLFL